MAIMATEMAAKMNRNGSMLIELAIAGAGTAAGDGDGKVEGVAVGRGMGGGFVPNGEGTGEMEAATEGVG